MVGGQRKFFENMESLDRWKWHFQSLLYLKADFQSSHEAPRSSLRVMHEHFHPITMLNSSFQLNASTRSELRGASCEDWISALLRISLICAFRILFSLPNGVRRSTFDAGLVTKIGAFSSFHQYFCHSRQDIDYLY